MMKKRCLFCDVLVPVNPEGEYDRYAGCSCSPTGAYSLLRESYTTIQSLPHQDKRDLLHVISGYIREFTDCGDKVTLSADDLSSIANSPEIPVTVEDKGNRLLQYLHRHSNGAGDPVVIHPLSRNFNLTYSPNIQELVYIIDQLSTDDLLVREGTNFQLTEKGWNQAIASAGGKKLKPCTMLIPKVQDLRTEWQEGLLPKLEQLGYLPQMLPQPDTNIRDTNPFETIADSKLIIADLTGQDTEVYFLAGYALGLKIPVIWTVSSEKADQLSVPIQDIRPILWDSTEELAVILQQRLQRS